MKKYTIEDLKGFEKNEEGWIICLAGDYTEITSFGEGCSFEGGHIAAPGYPLLTFGGFGSANRTTYAFNCKDGIVIRCGCFSGTLEEFRKKVRERHGDTPFAIEYLAVADLIERRFSREGEVR